MPGALSLPELDLINQLEATGLARAPSVLAVVMATRSHARPHDELVEIVRQYPGLEDPSVARSAVRILTRKNWLQTISINNLEITQQSPELRIRIEEILQRPGLAAQILQLRSSIEPYVRVVGSMKDEFVYSSFLSLLSSSQHRICLPMLVTPPYDETVRILQDRAETGVTVQILLGSPSLVARIRGQTMSKIASGRAVEWMQRLSGSTIEIRISHSLEDMRIATCVGVDDSVVRLDVYDPRAQRSLEGVMVEISSPPGMTFNFVEIFNELFENAWKRAQGLGRLSRLRWVLRRWWKLSFGFAILALAFLPAPIEHWSELVIGIGAGVIGPSIIEEVPRVKARLNERRSIWPNA